MAQLLKQSTACTIMFGVFVDKTDGVTLETGAGIITSIDHATTGIFLSKNGAAAAIRHQAVTASVLDAYGMFKVTLDATDTNTVGMLDVLMAEAATFLPVHKQFMVLPANVYDSLMGTDLLDVNDAQLLGTAYHAPALAGVPYVDVHNWVGAAAPAMTGDAYAEAVLVHAHVGTIDGHITADYGATEKSAIDLLDDVAGGLADIHTDVGTVDTVVDAVKLKTDLLPADTATQLDTNIPAIKAKTDLIPADVATQLDTNVPAIKTQTDKLVFTVANRVDANALQVGDKTGYTLTVTPPTAAQIKTEVEQAGSHLTLIKTKTDNLPSDPADESLLEAAIAAVTAPSVGDIDTQLSATHGSGSWEDRRHVPL